MPERKEYSEQTIWMLAIRDNRDQAAFSELFDHFAPRVKSLLMRAGSSTQQSEEIVQEVMLTVWRKANLFDPSRAQVSAWIYQIARNRHIDMIRKEKRPIPEELYEQADTEADPNQHLALEQESQILLQELKKLTPEQREMIEKAYFGDLSHREIQKQTGLPLGTIKSRIRLGLERLRHGLSGVIQ